MFIAILVELEKLHIFAHLFLSGARAPIEKIDRIINN